MTDLPRKNCDTIASVVAGTSTERLQHLLTDADWQADAVDERRVRHVVARSPRDGILVLNDTSFPKKGTHSVGVQPQYCGALGKIANWQVMWSVRSMWPMELFRFGREFTSRRWDGVVWPGDLHSWSAWGVDMWTAS